MAVPLVAVTIVAGFLRNSSSKNHQHVSDLSLQSSPLIWRSFLIPLLEKLGLEDFNTMVRSGSWIIQSQSSILTVFSDPTSMDSLSSNSDRLNPTSFVTVSRF